MDPKDQCLHIYVPGIMNKTYPDLDPDMLEILKDRLDVPMESDRHPYAKHIWGQVDFGSAADLAHMKWEVGHQGLE